MGLWDDYSPERLESLLREGKVTQQSIQAASRWMLEHREFLDDMATVWARVLRAGDAALQVVSLYVANDAMQVGARRFGRSVAAAFEPELLGVAEFVMASCDEKVKRCLLKVVGIWNQRHVVAPELLQQLQNVCAGRPAVDPLVAAAAAGAAPGAAEDTKAGCDTALKQMLSADAIEQALEDMPEVAESELTVVTTQRLQSLSSATISADLLSDRMFQLESSLSNFQHACEAFQATARGGGSADDGDAGFKVVGASAGDVVWEAMEPQVFELDVDKSRDHVQQYRLNLEEQSARRDELLAHLTALSAAELFPEPLVRSGAMDAFDAQRRALEQLYAVCSDAEAVEKRREAEKQAAYRESYSGRLSEGSSSSYDNAASYRRSGGGGGGGGGYTPRRGDAFSPRYDTAGGGGDRGAPLLRRHSSSDSHSSSGARYYDAPESRYSGGGGGAQSKRPKLQHAHSVDLGDATRRWGEPNSPPHAYRPPLYRDEGRYSPRAEFGGQYAAYNDRQSPRSGGGAGGSRWDMRPPPSADYGHRGSDMAPRDRRW